MLISLSDLLTWRLTGGERDFVLQDLLFDPDGRKLAWAIVSPAGFGAAERLLVTASSLGLPEAHDRSLPLHVTDGELQRAPRMAGGREDMLALMATMPPLVVGPFGSPHAPLPAGTLPEAETDPRWEAALERYESLADWIGKPVFGRDGEAGSVSDLLYEAQTGRLSHIVVDNGKFFGHERRVVPIFEMVTHADADHGGHIVLDLPLAQIETAPPVADMISG
ncbi:PRC-barrel domain-containing protein [Salipiger sp. PrR002]|uniref:PRC-barrel domain-containing protein n=1 Tax=Salipiger sp. PrR002 TaxID=2706489 RepID=UPI0013B5E1A5|nr:PRC-barrel domain-containing protein [Salipiger sp. PrR002]NDV99430.1 PRC-barrel domain containing protein [Salipiger sp. PrR002]NDW58694.1 PRC-barrel domain containing protein [Salipiger sp. PrR004]